MSPPRVSAILFALVGIVVDNDGSADTLGCIADRAECRMNRSLFNLITRAGRVSLDELLARSPVDQTALAREIVTMMQEGVVALSHNPDATVSRETISVRNAAAKDFLMNIEDTDEARQRFLLSDDANRAMLTDALNAALADEESAYSVMVSPTSWGFKITAA